MNIDNRVSFCAEFKPKVTLNQKVWEEVIPVFRTITNDYNKGDDFYMVQTRGNSGKPKYIFSVRKRENTFLAEDSVVVPNELLGKWLVEHDKDGVAKKLEKIFRILNIRRQAIFNLRKSLCESGHEQELIAERYLRRIQKLAQGDSDIVTSKEDAYNGKSGVWNGPFDAKREIYFLKDVEQGKKVIALV